jgi:hypothetical protein
MGNPNKQEDWRAPSNVIQRPEFDTLGTAGGVFEIIAAIDNGAHLSSDGSVWTLRKSIVDGAS